MSLVSQAIIYTRKRKQDSSDNSHLPDPSWVIQAGNPAKGETGSLFCKCRHDKRRRAPGAESKDSGQIWVLSPVLPFRSFRKLGTFLSLSVLICKIFKVIRPPSLGGWENVEPITRHVAGSPQMLSVLLSKAVQPGIKYSMSTPCIY